MFTEWHSFQEVAYTTLPDRPGRPPKPDFAGFVHPHSFRIRWNPPKDDGGCSVENYVVELCAHGQSWTTVYHGSGRECVCQDLIPGMEYKVRVACTSFGGVSDYSDMCTIVMDPVRPGTCAPPRPYGKPKPNSLHLRWSEPEVNGGAPITEFEVDMTSPDNKTRPVYRGDRMECLVNSLLPGRPYLFQVRAYNRVGPGPFSESLEIVSGAGAPDPPKEPTVTPRSPTSALIEWEAPIANGALVTSYQLQMAIGKCLTFDLIRWIHKCHLLSSFDAKVSFTATPSPHSYAWQQLRCLRDIVVRCDTRWRWQWQRGRGGWRAPRISCKSIYLLTIRQCQWQPTF